MNECLHFQKQSESLDEATQLEMKCLLYWETGLSGLNQKRVFNGNVEGETQKNSTAAALFEALISEVKKGPKRHRCSCLLE